MLFSCKLYKVYNYLGLCSGKVNQDTLKSQSHVKAEIHVYYCYKQEYIDKSALKLPMYVSQLIEHCVHIPQN